MLSPSNGATNQRVPCPPGWRADRDRPSLSCLGSARCRKPSRKPNRSVERKTLLSSRASMRY